MFKVIAIMCLLFSVANASAQNAEVLPMAEEATVIDNALDIEANVVEIVLNDEHRDGVDWGAIVSDFHTVALKREDNPVWADKKYKLSVGVVSDEDYAVLLEALDTVGRVSQALHPAFSLNGQTSADEILNDHVRVLASVVHPRVGEPKLDIEPHLTLMLSEGKSPRHLSTPVSLQAQTEVALKDNTTVVIGGIFKEEEITKTHKFPLLGSLPLVGLVFRSQGHWVQRTETVIFLNVRLKQAVSSQDSVDRAHAHH